MFIETILVPHPLAEDCYLGEALMWVAINRFPLDPLNEEAWDIRLELDDIVGLEPNVEVEGPTDLESARVGLSARPVHAGTLCKWAPEQLKETLADGDLEERTRQYLERELAASIAFRESCRRWDEEFSDFIDEHRARLFLALREGKLVAEGIKLPESTHEESLISLDQSVRGFREWVSIPPDFWLSDKINWEKSSAEGRDAAFALIQVKTIELFACFPPPAAEVVKLTRVANDLVSVEQAADEPKARMGRPSFDWDSFHVEIAMRIYSGNGLPAKQEALIADMQAWCQRTWRRDVGRSTLLEKIKPYYNAFGRRGC
jgi:hypothetical protein